MPSKIKKRGENSYLLTVAAGYEANGKQKVYTKTVHATSDREVETQYGLFLAEIQKGQISTSGKMTLEQFFNYWVKNHEEGRHAPKTIEYNEGLFKRIKATLGHKRLNQIQPKHILSFYENLGEAGIRSDKRKKDTLSPNTIRKYHILLHTLFEKATQWQLIAYNPVSKVEPPKQERHEKTIYDEETTGKFLLLLDKDTLKHKTMALLALSTGLRRGEMFGLQWKHIDFDSKTVKVEQASQYIPGKGVFLKEPKNEGSKRLISISDNIVSLLKQHKAKQAAKRLKLGGTKKTGGKWQGAEEPENDFVFTTWNGEAAQPDSINKWLNKFVEANGCFLQEKNPHYCKTFSPA